MTLEWYITRRFLRAVFLVALIIAGLSFLLTSVENIRITGSNGEPVRAALVLTLFQLPEIMGETFPLILMLAALAAFLGLSRTSEMVIVRASGISALRVLLFPVIAALLLGGVATMIFNPIVAAATARADAMKARITDSEESVLSFAGGSLWLRQGVDSGQTVIQASEASAEGTTLRGVRLHQFAPDNRLTTRVEAEGARLERSVWVLTGVRRWNLDLGQDASLGAPENLSQLRLPTNLTAEQIQDSFAPPNSIPIWHLPDFIAQLERAGFSATRHRVFLQSELARPALFVAMVLIGAGFSLRHVRFGQTGIMILFAIFAGFSLYFFKDIAETLGGNGDIPVALAAWSAPAAAIMLALGLLLHLEDG